jgi:membrane fusion protein (multidrug efflux system)
METEVDVPNPRLLLKPGMYGSAEIELERRPAAVTVPVQAVIHQDGKTVVMLVNAQHRIEAREIVTGLETPQSVEVASGLNDGDAVIIGNPGQLKAGQLVEPKLTQLGGEAKASGQAKTKSQDEAKGGGR